MKSMTAKIALPVLLAQWLAAASAQTAPAAPAAGRPAGPAAGPAAATPHKGGCIELTTVAEQEQTVTAADGSVSKRYVPAARIVPGTEVTWTTTARNVCRKAAEKVVIDQPVPEHMVFVAGSPTGENALVLLSTDGQEFRPAAELKAHTSDGTARPAGAEDVRAVRWALQGAIAPQTAVSVRYRATLQ
jgi:uncharacterized repeat protein (TIGR01451 family)